MSGSGHSPLPTEVRKSPQCYRGPAVAHIAKTMEEDIPSTSYSLQAGNLEIPVAEIPSNSQNSLSFNSSSIATSSNQLDESSSSQDDDDDDNSVSSKFLPDLEYMPVDHLDAKVTLLVEFLLQKYQMNETITKADMMDIVIQDCKDDQLEIIKRASECMELVFGLDMQELDSTNHYVFVNKLGLTYNGKSDSGIPKTGLLIAILGVIFIKGNRATEEEIWEVLNIVGLYAGKRHHIFGEPLKFITEDLVQEKYLEYSQIPNSNPPCYEFMWGSRAHDEINKKELLGFLNQIYVWDPHSFPPQFEEALRDQVQRVQEREVMGTTTSTDTASSSTLLEAPPTPSDSSDSSPLV